VPSGGKLRQFDSAGPLAVSPDGKTLAVAEWNFTPGRGYLHDLAPIRLLDLATGREVRRLRGHRGGVSDLAFSPDGGTIVSFGFDGTFRRWDARTGAEREPPTGHQAPVRAVAFSPDGKLLASCGDDHTVRLWDPLTGRQRRQFRVEHEVIQGVAFQKGGDVVLCQTMALPRGEGGKGTTRLRSWDVDTGREHRPLDSPETSSDGRFFCPDRPAVALVDPRQVIRLIDAGSGQEFARLHNNEKPLSGVFLSSDRKSVLTVSVWVGFRPESKISLWDAATGVRCWERWNNDGTAYEAAISPDGRVVASACGSIRLWESATGRDLAQIPSFSFGLAFSPDGKMLATNDDGKGVTLWEVATRKPRRHFAGRRVRCMAFSPDGRLLATGGWDTLVTVWDVTAGP
jgi:WD40 repeat protein